MFKTAMTKRFSMYDYTEVVTHVRESVAELGFEESSLPLEIELKYKEIKSTIVVYTEASKVYSMERKIWSIIDQISE
jgi:hypothetical protein